MSRCGFCDSTARKPHLFCGGICKKRYHAECVGVPTDVLPFLTTVPGLLWKCKTCFNFDNSNNEEKLHELFDKKFASLFQELVVKSETMKEDVIKIISDKLDDKLSSLSLPDIPESPRLPTTFSEAVRNNNKPKIIIKPKNQRQQNASTKADILRTINPVDLQIQLNKVKHISNGGILLGCNNKDDVNKFKQLADEKLSDKYDIREVKNPQPRIKLVGVTENYDEETFLQYLKQQNNALKSATVCKLIRLWPTKKNKNVLQATLQVDAETYKKVMSSANLLIGLDSCIVYDSLSVPRCFLCNSFHHTSKFCKNKVSCPLCAEQHELKTCSVNRNQYKCINCCNIKEKQKINIDVNHAAWSYDDCYAYKQAVEKLKFEIFGTSQ